MLGLELCARPRIEIIATVEWISTHLEEIGTPANDSELCQRAPAQWNAPCLRDIGGRFFPTQQTLCRSRCMHGGALLMVQRMARKQFAKHVDQQSPPSGCGSGAVALDPFSWFREWLSPADILPNAQAVLRGRGWLFPAQNSARGLLAPWYPTRIRLYRMPRNLKVRRAALQELLT